MDLGGPRKTRKNQEAHTEVTEGTEEISKLPAPDRLPISPYLLNL